MIASTALSLLLHDWTDELLRSATAAAAAAAIPLLCLHPLLRLFGCRNQAVPM